MIEDDFKNTRKESEDINYDNKINENENEPQEKKFDERKVNILYSNKIQFKIIITKFRNY